MKGSFLLLLLIVGMLILMDHTNVENLTKIWETTIETNQRLDRIEEALGLPKFEVEQTLDP